MHWAIIVRSLLPLGPHAQEEYTQLGSAWRRSKYVDSGDDDETAVYNLATLETPLAIGLQSTPRRVAISGMFNGNKTMGG
jgi:hypothetical protein